MDIASRDPNRNVTIQGVDSISFEDPTNIAANPTTHAMLVETINSNVYNAQAIKITVVTTNTYVGLAAPGSAQSSAVWQAFRIDSSSGDVVTWADGNADYDNVATDLAALNYS